MPRFEKGRAKTGGRKKGVPNRPQRLAVALSKLQKIVMDRAAIKHDNPHGQELLDRLAAAMHRYRNYCIINTDPKYGKYRRRFSPPLPRINP